MKKTITLLIIAFLVIINIKEEDKIIIPKEAIRFRVIANSNSNSDQQIKKEVSNNLKQSIDFTNMTSLENSRKMIKNSLFKYEKVINDTLQNKYSYSINYGNNYFPKKVYKGITYPEGEYESLIVKIGKGEGNNFWCVLFPPLCLLEAEDNNTKDIEYKSFVKEMIDKYFK